MRTRTKKQLDAAYAWEEETMDAYGRRRAPATHAVNAKTYSDSRRYY